MWMREGATLASKNPEPKKPKEPKKTVDSTAKPPPGEKRSQVEQTKINEAAAAERLAEETKLDPSDWSKFPNWFAAFKTSEEIVKYREMLKTRLHLNVRGQLAIKRLMRDFRDCQLYPIPGASR